MGYVSAKEICQNKIFIFEKRERERKSEIFFVRSDNKRWSTLMYCITSSHTLAQPESERKEEVDFEHDVTKWITIS